jgi:hypothetical protein
MAYERNPNDPYRANDPNRGSDPNGSNLADDEFRRAARMDDELQPDPELAEGPASTGRIALFAIAIAVVLGAVFYGLNNSSINHAGTSSTAQNTQSSPSAAPSGGRDMTPGANPNNSPGTTTGAAPARPQEAPSSAPKGQDVNRSGNPPTGSAPTSK